MTIRKIFISYSHVDTKKMMCLYTHLSMLQQHKGAAIEIWNDNCISAGQDWAAAIERAMLDARVGVLLISADFLVSDFILKEEVPVLLERRKNEGMHVFPILARMCRWQLVSWLREMQLRPRDNKPVWRRGGSIDDELTLIVTEIEALLDLEPSGDKQDQFEDAIKAEIDKARAALSQLWKSSLPRRSAEVSRKRQEILESAQMAIRRITNSSSQIIIPDARTAKKQQGSSLLMRRVPDPKDSPIVIDPDLEAVALWKWHPGPVDWTQGSHSTMRRSNPNITEARETADLIGSDTVEGTAVYNAYDQKMGSIERVMIEKRSGHVAYAVLSLGGFLGIASDYYPIPWASLSYDPNLGGYRTNITEQQLQGAPKYTGTSWDWNDRARGRQVYDYYGATWREY